MREKLHLKVVPKPNEDKPQPKPQTPAREFLMPDGRPVMIARHCVNFCAQAKEEGRTIVGVAKVLLARCRLWSNTPNLKNGGGQSETSARWVFGCGALSSPPHPCHPAGEYLAGR